MTAHSDIVRRPAVAGLFYPGDAATLRATVDELLAAAARVDAAPPKALVAPHAGYVYSGPIAATAYAALAAGKDRIRRVVLLGPVHRVPVRGLALPGCDAFDTPLGRVRIDRELADRVGRLPHVITSAAAHAQEHSLEVHLPFLQRVLGAFTLLPLAVGDATADDVAAVLDAVWDGDDTLIVVSSDLSHYLPYGEAQRIDRATASAILDLSTNLDHQQACGATPVVGLTLQARRRGLTPRLVDLRNSGDTAGDRSRVVGYGAFTFHDTKDTTHAV